MAGLGPPNGLEMSRPASTSNLQYTRFAAAGRVGSIELLGRSQRLGLFEPPEDAHGAEGIPAAGGAFGYAGFGDNFIGVYYPQGPATVCVALGGNDLDGFGHSRVWRHAGVAEVVQRAQNVVAPAGGIRELCPDRAAFAVILDGFTGR